VTFIHLRVQFHYPEVKCTYNTNVENDYCSTDFVSVGGEQTSAICNFGRG